MLFALCFLPFALCSSPFAPCPKLKPLCPKPRALCPLPRLQFDHPGLDQTIHDLAQGKPHHIGVGALDSFDQYGGQPLDGAGAYYAPTLIAGAAQDSEIVQGEVFGPVLVVLPFDDPAEAVALANDTPYGLASSIWTSDVARALRVSQQLQAGVTWVNDHLPIASEAPHGGVKASGFGVDMSQQAVLEHTVTHHVMVRHAAPPEREGFRPA